MGFGYQCGFFMVILVNYFLADYYGMYVIPQLLGLYTRPLLSPFVITMIIDISFLAPLSSYL